MKIGDVGELINNGMLHIFNPEQITIKAFDL